MYHSCCCILTLAPHTTTAKSAPITNYLSERKCYKIIVCLLHIYRPDRFLFSHPTTFERFICCSIFCSSYFLSSSLSPRDLQFFATFHFHHPRIHNFLNKRKYGIDNGVTSRSALTQYTCDFFFLHPLLLTIKIICSWKSLISVLVFSKCKNNVRQQTRIDSTWLRA